MTHEPSYSTLKNVNIHLLERWGSVFAGAALMGTGIRRSPLRAILGAELIRRGVTGHCFAYQALGFRTQPVGQGASVSVPYELGVSAAASITIAKPRSTVYQFWRELENLPRVMDRLRSVEKISGNRSRWVVEGPAGKQVEWIAEIHNDIPNELVAWRSLKGADVDSAGSVHFKDAPGDRGTEVSVKLQYNPPAGLIGATTAKLFGRDAETEIESGLFQLKQYLETGEIATTSGQPHGPSTSSRPSSRRIGDLRQQAHDPAKALEEVPV